MSVSLEDTTKKIKDLFGNAQGFSDTLTFDFGADGKISVDGSKSPPEVSNAGLDSDCTILVSLADLNEILDGSLNAQMAFMSGKLSVEGNMGIAMNLTNILQNE